MKEGWKDLLGAACVCQHCDLINTTRDTLQFAVGIKVPLCSYTHPPANLHTDAHTRSHRGSLKGCFFHFAHRGNRVGLCHSPSRTSARVCLSPRLWIKLAHTLPPCVSAYCYDHPPTHTAAHTTVQGMSTDKRQMQNFLISSLHKAHGGTCAQRANTHSDTQGSTHFHANYKPTDEPREGFCLWCASMSVSTHALSVSVCNTNTSVQCQCTVVAG